MAEAALGLRAHSGWATLVGVTSTPAAPALAVLERRRIELADPDIPGSRQPYHAAEGLDIKRAQKVVGRCADGARRLARQAIRAVLGDLQKKGHEVVGCGLLLASGRPLTTLAATLASHALIHTADGELFRDALAYASEQCGVPVTKIREREIYDQGFVALRLAAPELQSRINRLGKSLGPPWRQDEKLATLVAWLTLAAPLRR